MATTNRSLVSFFLSPNASLLATRHVLSDPDQHFFDSTAFWSLFLEGVRRQNSTMYHYPAFLPLLLVSVKVRFTYSLTFLGAHFLRTSLEIWTTFVRRARESHCGRWRFGGASWSGGDDAIHSTVVGPPFVFLSPKFPHSTEGAVLVHPHRDSCPMVRGARITLLFGDFLGIWGTARD